MSLNPLVSPATRLVANETKATYRPSALIAGNRLSASPSAPAEETLTRPLLEPATTADVDPAERLALEGAIRQLPAEQREVVHLHVFEGWTFQEVADTCGESINTIASRYRYALARLRETLGRGD